MILNKSHCFEAGGAYADLFLSSDRKLIYKVFVGPSHRSKGYAEDDEQRRRNTFEAECSAYSIATCNPALRLHVPELFERSIIEDILNEKQISVRGEYLIDCCYRMEFIDGDRPQKIGLCRSSYPHLEKAERDFRDAGVYYMEDCCVFFAHDSQSFKFIDFAVKDFPPKDYNPAWL